MTRAHRIVACLLTCMLAGPAFAQPADSEPPAAVPPGAKAEVTPITLPIFPIAFAVEASVADVAVQQVGRERRFTLAADVLFAFDRADLRPEADTALRKFLAQLGLRTGRASLRIEGHTDGKGADAYNDRLAIERARSVQVWLADRAGMSSAAMSINGFGKRRPVAPNTKTDGSDDPDGRQRNRRVEIVVRGP